MSETPINLTETQRAILWKKLAHEAFDSFLDGECDGRLSPREQLALQLRLPISGKEWLDDLIRETHWQECFKASLAGFASREECPNSVKWARENADEALFEVSQSLNLVKTSAGQLLVPEEKSRALGLHD